MKKAFLIQLLVFILLSIPLFAQDWPKTYTGTYASGLTESYDNGYFIAGPKNTYGYGMIFKTDINGDLLWEKTVGNGYGHWSIRSVEPTPDGGFIISGGMKKYDPGSGNDPFIMKFDACGSLDWCQVINTKSYYDWGICAKVTPTNEYVLLTIFSDPSPWHHTQLYKFDSTGALIWRQDYPVQGNAFEDEPRNLRIGSSTYLISGMCYYPDPGVPGGYERPYYICTDTAGNVNWRLVYGAVNGFHGFPFFQLLKSSSGFFYDVGWHSNFCDTPALWKFSESGEELYYQDLYPEACPGGNSALNILNDTTFILGVAGTIYDTFYMKIIKTDTFGVEQQAHYYTETWMKGTNYAIMGLDSKVAFLSQISQTIYFYKVNENLEFDSIYTMPRTYDSLCPYPIVSDTVDPDCGLIVSIQDPEKNPEAYRLKVYPNPATNKVTVEIPEFLIKRSGTLVGAGSKPAPDGSGFQVTTVYHQWGSATLVVYDLFGRKMMEQLVLQADREVEVEVSQWQGGMYVFRLSYRGETVATEKVVVE